MKVYPTTHILQDIKSLTKNDLREDVSNRSI